MEVQLQDLIEKIKTELSKLKYNWQAILLKVDKEGTVVLN